MKNNFIVKNFKPLLMQKDEITFFYPIKYKDQANKTNAGACITTEKLSIPPKGLKKLLLKMFY